MNLFGSSMTFILSATVLSLTALYMMAESVERRLFNEGVDHMRSRGDKGWDINLNSLDEEGKKEVKNDLYSWCTRMYIRTYRRHRNKYEDVKARCRRPQTIREKIKENSQYRSIFESVEEINKKVEEYRENGGSGVQIIRNQDVLKADMNKQKLDVWCQNKEREYYIGNENILENVRNWCYYV